MIVGGRGTPHAGFREHEVGVADRGVWRIDHKLVTRGVNYRRVTEH